MLTELYIEALLVDEELADQVWYMWDADVIDDWLAAIAWLRYWLSDKLESLSAVSRDSG